MNRPLTPRENALLDKLSNLLYDKITDVLDMQEDRVDVLVKAGVDAMRKKLIEGV